MTGIIAWVDSSPWTMRAPALKAGMRFGQQTQKRHACDENLTSFAHLAAASLVGCSGCLDFGYFMAGNRGFDVERGREIPRWRVSEVLTPLEREVLEDAEGGGVMCRHEARDVWRRLTLVA